MEAKCLKQSTWPGARTIKARSQAGQIVPRPHLENIQCEKQLAEWLKWERA
jgi:hypothetical protein